MQIRRLARLSLYLICSSLLLLLTTIVNVQADGSLVVEANEPQWLFGSSLQFHLTASSSTDINSVVLAYRTAYNRGTRIERLDFEPSHQIELTHEVDLTQHPLKPFVEVEYQWTVGDAAGQQLTTTPQRFIYEDNRFTWQPPLGQQIVLHWYDRDPTFGFQASEIAEQAVERIREMIDPALALSAPFHLYLYASEMDLASALPQMGREWAVGQVYPELRLAVLAVPPGPESTSTMRRLIPHELTHLLLYEAVGNDYAGLPPWLNEGLAVVSEEVLDPDDALVLDQAFQADQLIPLDVLCHTFPRQGDQVRLAYAQSASVVRFIQETYGHSAVKDLVAAYDNGLNCQEGVRKALKFSLSRLESQWRESLGTRSISTAQLRQIAPWLLLLLSSLPLLPLVAQPLMAHGRQQKHERLM
jgi:hypothetical protein